MVIRQLDRGKKRPPGRPKGTTRRPIGLSLGLGTIAALETAAKAADVTLSRKADELLRRALRLPKAGK